MIAGTLPYEPIGAAASAHALTVPSSSGYSVFLVLRAGSWVVCGAGPVPGIPQAQLSPELLVKAERAAKFFQQLPDDDAGDDPDYGLL